MFSRNRSILLAGLVMALVIRCCLRPPATGAACCADQRSPD